MKDLYLQRMGVVAWKERKQLLAFEMDSQPFFVCRLTDDENKLIGIILADINQDVSQDEQQILLKKISQALAPVVEINCVTDKVSVVETCQYLVLLGEQVSRLYDGVDNNMPIISSASLSMLQNNPSQKKALWMRLKPFAL